MKLNPTKRLTERRDSPSLELDKGCQLAIVPRPTAAVSNADGGAGAGRGGERDTEESDRVRARVGDGHDAADTYQKGSA